jgi:hypothetical protein
MVSYQKFVSVVFEVTDDDNDATEVMQWASERWNRNKDTLKTATVSETRDLVRRSL